MNEESAVYPLLYRTAVSYWLYRKNGFTTPKTVDTEKGEKNILPTYETIGSFEEKKKE